MRKLLCTLCLASLAATSSQAFAADAATTEADGFYAGIATGRLDFDFSDGTFRNPAGVIVRGSALNVDVDGKVPLRLSAGYNWGGWSVEAAYERMLGSADMQIGNTRLEFDYSNFTLGGAYRSAGTLYFIGKAGLSMPDIESKTAGTKLSMGNTGYAGVGLGYRFSPVLSLELDYTHTSDDTGTYMVGLRMKF